MPQYGWRPLSSGTGNITLKCHFATAPPHTTVAPCLRECGRITLSGKSQNLEYFDILASLIPSEFYTISKLTDGILGNYECVEPPDVAWIDGAAHYWRKTAKDTTLRGRIKVREQIAAGAYCLLFCHDSHITHNHHCPSPQPSLEGLRAVALLCRP